MKEIMVKKPWGHYIVLYSQYDPGYERQFKVLYINPGESLSLQTHEHRSEFWVCLAGSGKVEIEQLHPTAVDPKETDSVRHRFEESFVDNLLGNETFKLEVFEPFLPNDSHYIPKTYGHRLSNPGSTQLIVAEVLAGSTIMEADITRYEDMYGRSEYELIDEFEVAPDEDQEDEDQEDEDPEPDSGASGPLSKRSYPGESLPWLTDKGATTTRFPSSARGGRA